MSIVKPIASRRSMVHRLMINSPIIPANSTLVHKGTAVEISRSTDFTKKEDMLVSKKVYKEDGEDILTIKNTVMVSPDEVLYARYAYILGTKDGTEGKPAYKQEKWSRMSSTHGDQVGFKFDDNILATPYVTVSDYDNQVGVPQLKVSIEGYKVLIGSIGTHKYTTWEFTGTDNNIIYSRVKDEDNLTEILVSKDLFEANKIYFLRAKVYNSFNGESNYGTCVYNTGISTNVSYKASLLKPVYYGESININLEVFTPNVTGITIIIREANGDYEIPVDVFTKKFTISESLLLDFEELYNGPNGPLLNVEGTYKFYAQLEYTSNSTKTNGSIDYIDVVRLSRKELYPNRVDCDYTGNYYSLEDVELGPIVVNTREFKDGTFILGVNTHKVGPQGEYANELTLYAKYGKQIRSTAINIPLPLEIPAIARGNNNLPVVNILPMYTDMVMINYATFDLSRKNYKRSVWVLYKVDLITFKFDYLTHSVFEDEFLSTAESSSAVVTKNNDILYVPHGYGQFSPTTRGTIKTKGKKANGNVIINGDLIDNLPIFFSTDMVGLTSSSNFDVISETIKGSTLIGRDLIGDVQLTTEDMKTLYLARPSSVSVKDHLTEQTAPNKFDQFMKNMQLFECASVVQGDNKKLGVVKFGISNLTNVVNEGIKNNGLTIDFYCSVGNNLKSFLRQTTSNSNQYELSDIEFLRWGEDTDPINFSMSLNALETVKSIYDKENITFPTVSNNKITLNTTNGEESKLVNNRTFQYHMKVRIKNKDYTLNPFDIYYEDGRLPLPRMTIVAHLGDTNANRGKYDIYANGKLIGTVGEVIAAGTDAIPSKYPLVFKGNKQTSRGDLKPQPTNTYFNSIRFYDTPHDATRVLEGDKSHNGILPGSLGVYVFEDLPLMKLSIVKDTTGLTPTYNLNRTKAISVIKRDIKKHMTLVPKRGNAYSDPETYLIIGGTSDEQFECQNGPGGSNITGVYYYKLANLDVIEYNPVTNQQSTIGTLPQDLITYDEHTASVYNLSAQRRFDGKIVLFNNSTTSRTTGLAQDTTTWVLNTNKIGTSEFLVKENNDTNVNFPFKTTVVRNNGDMLRIAYSTTQQCSVLCYPADPSVDGVIDSTIANKHLVVKQYQRIAIDNPYLYDSITIEGDSEENTGVLTWIDSTRIRTFNCFDRVITRDLTETQEVADSKKKERLYVLDNVRYKITKE